VRSYPTEVISTRQPTETAIAGLSDDTDAVS
jgi:hypothetical protein